MSHIRGRLGKKADSLVVKYTSSLPFDWRLYRHDIAGSTAHAQMLAKQGIIPAQDGEAITAGLAEIATEIEQGRFVFKPEMEDIHMAIEARLLEKAGAAAAQLHTARSRNDQVALDMRLFAKEAIDLTREAIEDL
ncbi:MAG: lyase family protein, partial [Dehalococcoidales bacterium]